LTPKEVLESEHWRVRNTFEVINHPAFGIFSIPLSGGMSRTPLRVKWVSANIGEDNDFVFNKYGLKKKR
jgi:crotonobetainyl-CoA:carnitine CoA-transferase CaiB-like acyl-CoA transferase